MYLRIGTPPYFAFAVGKKAQYWELSNPTHWSEVNRLLQYVNGIHDVGICFSGFDLFEIFGFSDSGWTGVINDWKSTCAFVFKTSAEDFNSCSRNQTILDTSSCEAEYISLMAA